MTATRNLVKSVIFVLLVKEGVVFTCVASRHCHIVVPVLLEASHRTQRHSILNKPRAKTQSTTSINIRAYIIGACSMCVGSHCRHFGHTRTYTHTNTSTLSQKAKMLGKRTENDAGPK